MLTGSCLLPAAAVAYSVLELEQDTAVSFHVRRLPFTVSCVEGCVWVTLPADPGDHIVTPGAAFSASAPGHLVVTAMVRSRVLVSAASRRVTEPGSERYLSSVTPTPAGAPGNPGYT